MDAISLWFSWWLLARWWSYFGILHWVEVKCSNVSEECAASIFRVTQLIYWEAKVIQSNKYFFHTEQFANFVGPTTTICGNNAEVNALWSLHVIKLQWTEIMSQSHSAHYFHISHRCIPQKRGHSCKTELPLALYNCILPLHLPYPSLANHPSTQTPFLPCMSRRAQSGRRTSWQTMWFTESHTILVIFFLLVVLFTHFLLDIRKRCVVIHLNK